MQLLAARTLADAGRLDEASALADRLDKINVDAADRAGVHFLRGLRAAERAGDRPKRALPLYEQARSRPIPARADVLANAILGRCSRRVRPPRSRRSASCRGPCRR